MIAAVTPIQKEPTSLVLCAPLLLELLHGPSGGAEVLSIAGVSAKNKGSRDGLVWEGRLRLGARIFH